MGLKKSGRGPFHGPTLPRVLQTVDVGSDAAHYIRRQAALFPRRQYAVIDKVYKARSFDRFFEGELSNISSQSFIRDLEKNGVHVFSSNLVKAIRAMKRAGVRVRHFNFDMPNPHGTSNRYGLHFFFRELPHVLLPNGKVFIHSESTITLQQIRALAVSFGFRVRNRKPRPREGFRTRFMIELGGSELPFLEITFGLKKAVPSKAQRRQWPMVGHGVPETKGKTG